MGGLEFSPDTSDLRSQIYTQLVPSNLLFWLTQRRLSVYSASLKIGDLDDISNQEN